MPNQTTCPFGTASSVLVSSLVLTFVLCASASFAADFPNRKPIWLGTWAAATQIAAVSDLPSIDFANVTLRQIVHVSVGGKRLRVRLSNVFGGAPLELEKSWIASSAGGSAIEISTQKKLTFQGRDAFSIAPGTIIASDPIDFDLRSLSNVVGDHFTGARTRDKGLRCDVNALCRVKLCCPRYAR